MAHVKCFYRIVIEKVRSGGPRSCTYVINQLAQSRYDTFVTKLVAALIWSHDGRKRFECEYIHERMLRVIQTWFRERFCWSKGERADGEHYNRHKQLNLNIPSMFQKDTVQQPHPEESYVMYLTWALGSLFCTSWWA